MWGGKGAARAQRRRALAPGRRVRAVQAQAAGPLRVAIAGAPASGKGTQCEGIVDAFGVAHISAGDLLRAAVAEGTGPGLEAKEYMDAGKLVPDEVVVTMVKDRLAQPDAQDGGWLLDGYPRSKSQADAITAAGIVPEVFILLDVPDEVLIDRVIGRRLDPETGKIYHMTFAPPPPEIADRLTQRSDDTEEKARTRLGVYYDNIDAIKDAYSGCIVKVDGNRSKDEVGAEISSILKGLRA